MKVKLSRPIQAHGEEVQELTFRELRAGDLRGVRMSIGPDGLSLEMGAILDVAARLAGVPPSSLDQLPLPDLVAIAEQVGPLLDRLLPTGTTS